MKVSGILSFSEFSRGVAKLLRTGNGLIAHGGTPRYTANKIRHSVRLAKNELHTLAKSDSYTTITARSGLLWVTQENDGKDHPLQSGDSLQLTGKGKLVIEALQAGEFDLSEK